MSTPPVTGDQRRAHIAAVKLLVKPGDFVMHTRCMGVVEEHIFTQFDGEWMCGWPTPDTKRIEGSSPRARGQYANDIAPSSVTHINRTPIDVAMMLAEQDSTNAP